MLHIHYIILIIAFMLSPLPLQGAESGALLVGGSTTMQPVVTQSAEEFTKKFTTWRNADPILPDEPIVIQTVGGGSSYGTEATISGVVSIGMLTRPLKEQEQKTLGEHQTFMVAFDALGIVAHIGNPLIGIKKSFSATELATLFSGELKHYQDLVPSLPDQRISMYGRALDAGSSELLLEKVMKGKSFSNGLRKLTSHQDLIRKLVVDPWAIGYVSVGFARQKQGHLVIFEVDGVPPNDDTIRQGRYLLVRPMQLLVKGKPSAKAQRFIDYMLTDAQQLVAQQHFVPIRAMVAQ